MKLYNLMLVGLGGFAGSVLRYLTSQFIDKSLHSIFPYGTFVVNVVGSFVLGIVFGIVLRSSSDQENLRLLLITGFCGGFTTFSAFAFENLKLIEDNAAGVALLYIIGSVLLGIMAVFGGIWLARTVG